MKRIAALALVAAVAATGASADNATKPTVSTQAGAGLGMTAMTPGLIVGGLFTVGLLASLDDAASSSTD